MMAGVSWYSLVKKHHKDSVGKHRPLPKKEHVVFRYLFHLSRFQQGGIFGRASRDFQVVDNIYESVLGIPILDVPSIQNKVYTLKYLSRFGV